MKIYLLAIKLVLFITLLVVSTSSATMIDDAELLPIPKGGYTFVTTGPTEAEFGQNVWVLINGEEWRKTSDGTDFLHIVANIYGRLFDNAKYEFYYLAPGNKHMKDYPSNPGPVPISPPIILLATGLIGLASFRKRRIF